MVRQFMMQHLLMLMASITMVVASTKDDINPTWRKIAESGPVVGPELTGREDEPGM